MMGYRIVYGPEISSSSSKKGTGLRLRSLVASALLAFSLLVRCFWPEGCEKLRLTVLPEAATQVQIAAEAMVDDLRKGKAMSEALTAFCIEVIHSDEAA